MNDQTRYDRSLLPLEVLGRIDRICGRFESEWESGGRPRIEDFLDEIAEDYRPALLGDLLAAELDTRRRRGECPQASEYLERFPSDAGAVAGAFAASSDQGASDPGTEAGIQRLDREVLRDTDVGSTRPADADVRSAGSFTLGVVTGDGERFRVLRPHARGGLGAVFVALDLELHREVALKQILERHADDPVSRSRFLLEAEITGGLEHPGIVPVYGLGTYDGGRPFYAMRFVKGESLKEAIDRFHGGTPVGSAVRTDPSSQSATKLVRTADPTGLELRRLLRRFLDVCNAIDYAHSRGVLHRDIKPANIIVGKHGETLVVDWGLAKATGKAEPGTEELTLVPSSASGTAETLPGSALGTPAYMSPEQARGDLEHLGPRSDVYALGATLYCLLTGRPPLEGDDVGDLMRRAQRGEFPTPRHHDPTIDRALEAVCLKAMARSPEDRYGSCRSLAEDVERWMADEPVTAWREPFSRRARRWGRRNRTLVATAAVAMLVALGGMATVLAVQAQSNTELRSLNGRLEQTNAELAEEKSRVQQRFDLAMRAIQTFHTGVSEDFLLKEDKFKDLRDKLLTSAADFYGKLGALLKQRSDRDSRRALAQAGFELAELVAKVGDANGALDRHREVLSLREALAAEPGAESEAQAEVGRSLVALGRAQEVVGRTDEALASYRSAQAHLSRLAGVHPDVTAYRADLAGAEHALGWLLFQAARPAEGLNWLEKARDARAAQAESDPSNTTFGGELAASLQRIARLLWETGRLEESLKSARQALAIRQQLVETDPASTVLRYGLADSQSEIGILLQSAGQSALALEAYSNALENYRRVAEANPAVSSFQAGLGYTHNQLSDLFKSTGQKAEAVEQVRRAVEIYLQLARSNPEVFEYQIWLSQTTTTLSEMQAKLGQLLEALESARRSIEVARGLVASNPERTTSRSVLANALISAGRVQQKLGRLADAAASLREGVIAFEKIPLPARQPEADYNLACCRALLSGVLSESGSSGAAEARVESKRAMAALRLAVTRGYRKLDAMQHDSDLDALRSRPDFQLLILDLAFPAQPFAPGE